MTVSPWSLQAAIRIRHKAPNAAWNSLRDFALRARASRSTSRGGYASTVVRNPFDRPIHVRDEDDSGLGGQHSPSTRGPPSRIGFQEVIEESCKGDHLVLSGTCAEQLLQ